METGESGIIVRDLGEFSANVSSSCPIYAVSYFPLHQRFLTVEPLRIWNLDASEVENTIINQPKRARKCMLKWDEHTVLIGSGPDIESYSIESLLKSPIGGSFPEAEKIFISHEYNKMSPALRLEKLGEDLFCSYWHSGAVIIVNYSENRVIRKLDNYVNPGYYSKLILSKKFKNQIFYQDKKFSSTERSVARVDFMKNELIRVIPTKTKIVSLTTFIDKKDNEILICGGRAGYQIFNEEGEEEMKGSLQLPYSNVQTGTKYSMNRTVHTLFVLRGNILMMGFITEIMTTCVCFYKLDEEGSNHHLVKSSIINPVTYDRTGMFILEENEKVGMGHSGNNSVRFLNCDKKKMYLYEICGLPMSYNQEQESMDVQERIMYLREDFVPPDGTVFTVGLQHVSIENVPRYLC